MEKPILSFQHYSPMNLVQINCCIIVPTYNNHKTLARIIDGVLIYSVKDDVIVVNDGSTDATAEILEKYEGKIIVISNGKNTGKGYSLRKGFKEAINRGFENAITIDSDGQHFPEDIPNFIRTAATNKDALIMGSRNMNQAGVPGKSSFGNKFSNFWFKVETGISLPDTQTGFRLYPLNPLQQIKLHTKKFETEIEIIVKLAWNNVKIIPIDIVVLYDPNERVSHFRPFQDFTRISILNTFLVIMALFYYGPKKHLLKVYHTGIFSIIKQEATKYDESNLSKATSIGFGVFMGIVPIWGLQLLIGIPLAILFRLNKVLFFAAANISIPPMIPIIIYLSYFAGSFFVTNKVQLERSANITIEMIHLNIIQYAVGAMVLATIAGIAFFLFFYFLLAAFRNRKTIN